MTAVSARARAIRVATYNVHKCRGLDGRVRPRRIAEVLRELDADVIALQEVVRAHGPGREADQARFLAEELGAHPAFGENRRLSGGGYGNLVLTRLPLREARNYDISAPGCEPRGCLRVDIDLNGAGVLHVFNVHLGTAFFERRRQARALVHAGILNRGAPNGPRVVLGDFNEWTRGLASRLLGSSFESADIRAHLRRSRTYPGILPLLHLDHIYFDPALRMEGLALHRSRTALVASDHLPLVADFRLAAPGAAGGGPSSGG